jgi:hypothetical protein
MLTSDYNASMFIVKQLPQFEHWLFGLKDGLTAIALSKTLQGV